MRPKERQQRQSAIFHIYCRSISTNNSIWIYSKCSTILSCHHLFYINWKWHPNAMEFIARFVCLLLLIFNDVHLRFTSFFFCSSIFCFLSPNLFFSFCECLLSFFDLPLNTQMKYQCVKKALGKLLTDPFNVLLVDTRRWNIRAGSVSFSLSDDSSAFVAAAIACVTSFGRGDGVRDEDDPIDGIDNGDLLAIIF